MRSSRLLALLMAVQRRGHATAPELAEEFGVSVRTIHRDVAALQEAGVPLWTAAGVGGGVRLVDGWRSPVDGLTTDEASALMVGPAVAGLGLASVLSTARSKVRSGLPPAVRTQVEVIGERFLLDAQRWFDEEGEPAALPELADAVWQGHRVDLRYGSRSVRRRVDPLGLVLKAGRWYLVAAHRGSPRTYRCDKIGRVAVLEDAVRRPPGFVLSAYWERTAREFDEAIRPLDVTLRIPERSRWSLQRAVQGPATTAALETAVAEDGRLLVRMPMERIDIAGAQLLGVPGVEVLEPPELRRMLHERGAAIAAHNA